MSEIDFADLRRACREIGADLEADATVAMQAATQWTKEELRRQSIVGQLGQKLAKTWQSKVYPLRNNSVEAAGYVYSRAPAIADAFASGATIRATRGGKYLWIPTAAVPRRNRRGQRRMSPEEVEAQFNQDLVIRRMKTGNLGAFIARERGTTKRGEVRRVRKGRLAQGDRAELVLMFTLVRATKVRKVFDLADTAERGAQLFADLMGRD